MYGNCIDLQNINSVCLYFLALNLILHSKGILQQNSLSRNLKFYFFCIQLFQAVWSSTIGGNNCITYLLGPSPTPSMHAAAEPRELLGSAFTGSQAYHSGLLVWQTEPDAVMAISQGVSWHCLDGQLWLMQYSVAHQDSSGPSLSVLPHSTPCALFYHACLQVISVGFHEAQMLGQRW